MILQFPSSNTNIFCTWILLTSTATSLFNNFLSGHCIFFLLFCSSYCVRADQLVQPTIISKVNYDDFSLLCAEGIPLLMEDHRPRPCQPKPWLEDQRCPRGFWCHEGEDTSAHYCCPQSRRVKNFCHLPPATGFGKQSIRRFYYDWKTDGCHELLYTGIGGNQNSFLTYDRCETTCRGAGEPPKSVQLAIKTPQDKIDKGGRKVNKESSVKPNIPEIKQISTASLPPIILATNPPMTTAKIVKKPIEVVTTMKPFIPVSEVQTRKPKPAKISFATTTTTTNRPKVITTTRAAFKESSNPCNEVPNPGQSGGLAKQMWYFDSTGLTCVQFTYLGIGGNSNKFETASDCIRICGIGKPTRKSCDLPPAIGDGSYKIPRYYFDSSTKQCELFYYSGNNGNDNRFYKKHKCERLCLGKKQKKKEHSTISPIVFTKPTRAPARIIQNLVSAETQKPIVHVFEKLPTQLPEKSTTNVPHFIFTTKSASTTVESYPTLVYVPTEYSTTSIPVSPNVIEAVTPNVDHIFSNLMSKQLKPGMLPSINPIASTNARSEEPPAPLPPIIEQLGNKISGSSSEFTNNELGSMWNIPSVQTNNYNSKNIQEVPQVVERPPSPLSPVPITVSVEGTVSTFPSSWPSSHNIPGSIPPPQVPSPQSPISSIESSASIPPIYPTVQTYVETYTKAPLVASTLTQNQLPPVMPPQQPHLISYPAPNVPSVVSIPPPIYQTTNLTFSSQPGSPAVANSVVSQFPYNFIFNRTEDLSSPSGFNFVSQPAVQTQNVEQPIVNSWPGTVPLVSSSYASQSSSSSTSTSGSRFPTEVLPSSVSEPNSQQSFNVHSIPTDTYTLNLTEFWPQQQIHISNPSQYQTGNVQPHIEEPTATIVPIPPVLNFTFGTLNKNTNNNSANSPCLYPIIGDPIILCESQPGICPHRSFCQIGEGQSMCCPVIDNNPCAQPTESGVGQSKLIRWTYDASSSQCIPFLFKGFKGNQNNFIDFNQCLIGCRATSICSSGSKPVLPLNATQSCSASNPCPENSMCHSTSGYGVCCPTSVKVTTMSSNIELQPSTFDNEDPCSPITDQGYGLELHHRWSFDPLKNDCISFIYKGRGGNKNNFVTKNDCQAICKAPDRVPGKCLEPPRSGNGNQYLTRYFYSPEYRQCLKFIYSGVGGNDNNFDSQVECLETCVANGVKFSSLGTTPPPSYSFTFLKQPVCPQGNALLDANGEPVRCEANQNQNCPSDHICRNMGSVSYCCPAPESFCLQSRPALSVCSAGGMPVQEIRFTYDPLADKCVRFTYENCSKTSSTSNIFNTKPQCMKLCCNQGLNLIYKKKLLKMMMNDDPVVSR